MKPSPNPIKNLISIGFAGKVFLAIAFSLFLSLNSFSQIMAVQDGNWDDPATWDVGVPTANDDVIISDGWTVTVRTTGAACASLILGYDIGGGALLFSGTSSLTVTGNITMGDINGGFGSIALDADASLTCAGFIEGDPGFSSDFVGMNVGTINFTGSNNNLPAGLNQFMNLVIQSGTTTLEPSTNIVILGNLTIKNGATLDLLNRTANRSSLGDLPSEWGTLTIEENAQLKIGGGGSLCANFYYHSIGLNSTIHYIGTTQTISNLQTGQKYANLVIDGSGIKNITTATVITGNLTVNGAAFDMDQSTFGTEGSNKTLTVANGATFIVGSNTFPTGFATHSIGETSTFEFDGGNQAIGNLISGQQYGHMVLSGTNGNKTLSGNATVRGTLTYSGSATTFLAIGANTLTLNGPIVGASATKGFQGGSTSNLILNNDHERTLFFRQQLATQRTLASLNVNSQSSRTLLGSTLVCNSLTLTTGKLALNGQSLTIAGTLTNTVSEGLQGTTSSTLIVTSGNPSLSFDQTTPGNTNAVGTFQVNGSNQVATMLNNLEVANQLTFTNGKLNINGQTLTIKGAVTNTVSGGLRGSSTSRLIVNSTTSPTLSFDQTTPGTTNLLSELTNNSSGQTVTLGNALRLINVFYPTAGTLASAGNLTLVSTNANTARIAQGHSGTYITGNINAERYFPAKRSWRLLTAPVLGSMTIQQAWQNNGVFEAGKGMLVTAPTLGPGIDAVLLASMKTWNESTQTLSDVTNTQVPVSGGANGTPNNNGYFVFVRGDRTPTNIDLAQVNTNVTTFMPTGTTFTGTQTYTNLSQAAGGFSLIGNPYPSPIDMNLMLNNSGNSNLQRKIYVWDPKLNKVGGYVVLDDVITPGVFAPTPSNSSQDNHIQSGQAFYVITNSAGSAVLEIQESNKSATNKTMLFGRPGGAASSLIANLYLKETEDSVNIADGTRVDFSDAFSAAIDIQDNNKLTNTNETFGTVRNGRFLSTERRPELNDRDTIFFRLNRSSQRNYRFVFEAVNFSNMGYTAMLEDSYTNIAKPVNLDGSTTIDFSVDGNTASQLNSRFRIVFAKTAPLPVVYSNIRAYQRGQQVNVEWTTSSEINTSHYEVEKSVNGVDFSKMATVQARGAGRYETIDATPAFGDNYYRIRNYNRDGSSKISPVQLVTIDKGEPQYSVYPNPSKDGIVSLQMSKQPRGTYHIRVFNMQGQTLMTRSMEHQGGSATQVINLPAQIKSGTYQMEIQNNQGQKTLLPIVVQ